MPRRAKASTAAEASSSSSSAARGPQLKFPVARIKKMMQADEDVGKVAQATPVVISKALELFLADVVSSTVAQTQAKGARKVTPHHLKRAVHDNETLDFLKDIVDKVPDPVEGQGSGAGGGRRASNTTGPRKRAAPAAKKEEDEDGQEEEEEDDEDEASVKRAKREQS
ncbi:histone-fold-containing protein [Jaminaea rosea]|uniref:Histone-fold-containing protein n=1 Tax=Jaminaea rosea TaxID=1569628 RepID=A0A316UKF2_9BASI|nr:histone-fold-containing protein [Jaminaea rosea]PWN25746.1 histone-fold-containing protein [Jaminaea rosea]